MALLVQHRSCDTLVCLVYLCSSLQNVDRTRSATTPLLRPTQYAEQEVQPHLHITSGLLLTVLMLDADQGTN